MAQRLYVVAGELSGDAHGAGLLGALRPMVPDLQIRGVGGPGMVEAAGDGLRDWVEDAAVMGVWEVLKRYGWFKQRFAEMLEELKAFDPDVLLLIDYPGFNLRFAEAVKRECPRIKIVYYVSPQVWAWNKKRIPKMVRLLDQMICLFPFEVPIFREAGLKSDFVGHPLVDELAANRLRAVERDPMLVGLFPGSREREVARLLPMMMETARHLQRDMAGLSFEVPAASATLARMIEEMIEAAGMAKVIRVGTGSSHSLMQRAGCGVIASGTATLEAAFFGLPYCLVYRVAPLTYVMARLLVKIKFIGIVNILAGEEVVREFIQGDAQAGKVAPCLKQFLESPESREAFQQRMDETTAMLGEPGSHQRVASLVADWFPTDPES